MGKGFTEISTSQRLKKIEKQYQKMLKFIKKYRLKTNPLKSLREWAKLIIEEKNGGCPCEPKRKVCPCPQALKEIEKDGKCLCGKFFSSQRWEKVWGWIKDDPNFNLEEWNR